jgi:hypothetical protein
MGWLLRKMCEHRRENLYIETSEFLGGAQSKRIMCVLCRKEIVPAEHFETLKMILTTASTGHPDKPSAS